MWKNLADQRENMTLQHHINQAIKARGVMKRDVDYVVRDGEGRSSSWTKFAGRSMLGRRYNEGLHQAIEAKGGRHRRPRKAGTLATRSRVPELSSACTTSSPAPPAPPRRRPPSFRRSTALPVVEVPTNKPVARARLRTTPWTKPSAAKFNAVIDQVHRRCREKGQPVLVRTRLH